MAGYYHICPDIQVSGLEGHAGILWGQKSDSFGNFGAAIYYDTTDKLTLSGYDTLITGNNTTIYSTCSSNLFSVCSISGTALQMKLDDCMSCDYHVEMTLFGDLSVTGTIWGATGGTINIPVNYSTGLSGLTGSSTFQDGITACLGVDDTVIRTTGCQCICNDLTLYNAGAETDLFLSTYTAAPQQTSSIHFNKSTCCQDDILQFKATNNNDVLGKFTFNGTNSAEDSFVEGARIYAKQNGSAGDSVPTDLYFTTCNLSSNNSCQLVLHNSGSIGIGTTDPDQNYLLDICGSINADNLFTQFNIHDGTNTSQVCCNGYINFATNGAIDISLETSSNTFCVTGPSFPNSTLSADGTSIVVNVSSVSAEMLPALSSEYITGYVTGGTFDNSTDCITFRCNSGCAFTVNINGYDYDSLINKPEHDSLVGFVANEHIDHTSVSFNGIKGIEGGGDISSSRTFCLSGQALCLHEATFSNSSLLAKNADGTLTSVTTGAVVDGSNSIPTSDEVFTFVASVSDQGNVNIDHSTVCFTGTGGIDNASLGDITTSRTVQLSGQARCIHDLTLNNGSLIAKDSNGNYVSVLSSTFMDDTNTVYDPWLLSASDTAGCFIVQSGCQVDLVGNEGIDICRSNGQVFFNLSDNAKQLHDLSLGVCKVIVTDNTNTITQVDNTVSVSLTGLSGDSSFTLGGTLDIGHADTSSQANITSSSRTYINSVTLDDYGHVTGLTTGTETVTDTNTTYDLTSENGGIIRLSDGSNNDDITIEGGNNVTVTTTANNNICIDASVTDGYGCWNVGIGTTGGGAGYSVCSTETVYFASDGSSGIIPAINTPDNSPDDNDSIYAISFNSSSGKPFITHQAGATGFNNRALFATTSASVVSSSDLLVSDPVNNRLGINVASPNEALTVSGNLSTDGHATFKTLTIQNTGNACSEPLTISGDVDITGNIDVSEAYKMDGTDIINTNSEIVNLEYKGTAIADTYISSSEDWNSVYTSVNSTSATWDTVTTKLPLAGGTITGNLTVNGNFLVEGTTTTINTTVTATSAMCIQNDGTGPALELNQTGTQPIVDFQDDGTSAFYIEDGGNVGIGTNNPNTELTVVGNISASTLLYDGNNNSSQWTDAYNNYITGIQVSGTGTKTITLTQRDGGTITANFTDNDTVYTHPTHTAITCNCSNGIVLQDISVDSCGHVTSVGACNLDDRYFTESEVNTCLNAKQDTLTFGIANTNALKVDDTDAADNDYAKFTANGLEGRSAAEVRTDLGLGTIYNCAATDFDKYTAWRLYTDTTDRGDITSGEQVRFCGGTGISLGYAATNNVITINHPTQTAITCNCSNGTVLQDITVNDCGHVTAVGACNLDDRYYTETESDNKYLLNTTDTLSGTLETFNSGDSSCVSLIPSGGSPYVLLNRTGSNSWKIKATGNGSAQTLDTSLNDTSIFTIEAGGNVGIGTTNPNTTLTVSGSISASSTICENGKRVCTANYPTVGAGCITLNAGTDLSTGGGFNVNQAGASTITIDHSDITRTDTTSTASPANGGTVSVIDSITSNARGHITAANVKTITLPSNADTVDNLHGTQFLRQDVSTTKVGNLDFTSNNACLSLSSYGRVGIGMTDPQHPLEICLGDNSTFTSGLVFVQNSGNRGSRGHSSGSALFQYCFSDHPGMILNKDGNVGIGTDDPSSDRLKVSGTVCATGDINGSGNVSIAGTIYSGGTLTSGTALRICNNSNIGIIIPTTLTGTRTYTLQNASGTLAHTSDLPTNYITNNADDTMSGTLTVTGNVISNSSITAEGNLCVDGTLFWFVNDTDRARQRADARDDATNFARLHWYGQNDAGSTSNFRHAWYDGAAYIHVTATNCYIDFDRTDCDTCLKVDGTTIACGTTLYSAGAQVCTAAYPSNYITNNADDVTTGCIDFHASDNETIIKSGNTSATGTPDQFFIAHNLGNVNIGNSRGSVNISQGVFCIGGCVAWHSGNDGAGSGLHADCLDGQHGSYYLCRVQAASSLNNTCDLNDIDTAQGWYKWSGSNPTNSPSTYAWMLHICDNGQAQQLVQAHGGSANKVRLFGRRKTSGSWDTSWTEYWSNKNDGASSGLDADCLDGQEGTYYLDYDNFTNKPTIPTDNSQLANSCNYCTTDTNTTYGISIVDVAGNGSAKIRLTGSDSTTDDVTIATTQNITIEGTDANTITITGPNLSSYCTAAYPSNYITNDADDEMNGNLTVVGFVCASNLCTGGSVTGPSLRLSNGNCFGVFVASTLTASRIYTMQNASGTVAFTSDIPTNNNQLTNGAGYTTNTGDITNVIAGTGLSGGGTSGEVTLSLPDVITAGAYGNNSNGCKIDKITVDAQGRVTDVTCGPTGDIQAVSAGTGLSGGGTSGSVTLNLADTAVTAGSYTNADITVDAQGRITSASNGSSGGTDTNDYVDGASFNTANGNLTLTRTGALADIVTCLDGRYCTSDTNTTYNGGNCISIVSGDINHDTGGAGAASYGATTANTGCAIRQITLDAYGHVTAVNHGQVTTCTSDYRAKTCIQSYDVGYDAVKNVDTYKYVLIDQEEDEQHAGLMAHELQEAGVDYGVTGTKDEVDEAGKPVYQTVDYTRLVPTLWSALKTAINKIEDLETRLATLELQSNT